MSRVGKKPIPLPKGVKINIGDELHHTGWNACSSCHHDPTKQRRYLIVPGVRPSIRFASSPTAWTSPDR